MPKEHKELRSRKGLAKDGDERGKICKHSISNSSQIGIRRILNLCNLVDNHFPLKKAKLEELELMKVSWLYASTFWI